MYLAGTKLLILVCSYQLMSWFLFVQAAPEIKKVEIEREELHERLLQAAVQGNILEVKKALHRGADIHTIDSGVGSTPLIWAATNGHLETVTALLNEGANIEARSKDGMKTTLLVACHGGYVELVSYLLSKGASIHTKNSRGDTPLSLAVYMGHDEVVDVLLPRYDAVSVDDQTSKQYYTALHFACFKGRYSIAKKLVAVGADIDITEKGGKTPLMLAAMEGFSNMVAYLIKKGADVDVKDKVNGATALLLAINGGHPNCAKILIEDGKSSLEIANQAGLNPLLQAVTLGNIEISKMLILNGADYSWKSEQGDDLLSIATKLGNDGLREMLAELLLN